MPFAIESLELTKKFGDFVAVDTISFQVEKGTVFGFLGANGAGKTTCIRMLTGLLKPTFGTALIGGYDVVKQPEKVKQNIGYMSQLFSLYADLTVLENIALYGGIYGLKPKTIRSKAQLMLQDLQLEEASKKRVSDLPLGWKQKLAFSVALLHEPKIVFLDEPTSGVDPNTRQQFWELIYRATDQGITIFMTTHYMPEAEYCDQIAIMAAGKLEASGTSRELKDEFEVQTMDEVFIRINDRHRKALNP